MVRLVCFGRVPGFQLAGQVSGQHDPVSGVLNGVAAHVADHHPGVNAFSWGAHVIGIVAEGQFRLGGAGEDIGKAGFFGCLFLQGRRIAKLNGPQVIGAGL